MASPAQRLSALGLSAKKSLGQHFLHDRAIVERICDVAQIGSDSTIVEIGPGLGILTEALARRASRVISIEKDAELAAALGSVVPPNVSIVAADALTVDIEHLNLEPYDLVANLPYNVATAILRHFLDSGQPPARATFMVQREVARRIVARPPEMNILAVTMQFHGDPRIAFAIGAGAFTPPPRVSSAVVHMQVRRRFDIPQAELGRFFALVRAGFSAKRKQLKNSLANGGIEVESAVEMLDAAGIVPSVRPQELDVDDWFRIYCGARRMGVLAQP